jgi:two-component system sensor kinase FixL
VIEADPLQMRQLFQNLLSNALKFQREGVQPLIRVSFTYTDERHSAINIFVEDNGIGFDVKYLDRIFNIFQRLEGRTFEGSGVGLAICRKIAQRHGGEITAESEPGKGSTFIVTLPVKQSLHI